MMAIKPKTVKKISILFLSHHTKHDGMYNYYIQQDNCSVNTSISGTEYSLTSVQQVVTDSQGNFNNSSSVFLMVTLEKKSITTHIFYVSWQINAFSYTHSKMVGAV
jgi:hypothetical protein